MPRRYVAGNTVVDGRTSIIQKDQQKLLDKPESWAETLKNGPQGLGNAPASVLRVPSSPHNTASSSHHAVPSSTSSSTSPQSDPEPQAPEVPKLANGRMSTPQAKHRSLQSRTNLRDNSHSDDDDSDEGDDDDNNDEDAEDDKVPIPWSSSPNRENDPAIRAPPETTPTPESSRPPRHLPAPSATHRPPSRTASPTAAVKVERDSSSDSEDEALDVSIPEGRTSNKAAPARPEPTPPSAQVVPCSSTVKDRPAKPPVPKRDRRMKPICLGVDPTHVSPRLVPSTYTTSPVDKQSREVTNPQKSPLRDQRPWVNGGGTVGPSSETHTLSASLAPRTVLELHQPALAPAPEPEPEQQPASPLASNGGSGQASAPVDESPFGLFTTAYPDYTADLTTFLRTCIYIRQCLRPFLWPHSVYDDFARAFWQEFTPYVSTPSHEDIEELLTAIHWYNKNGPTKLRYTKGILTDPVIDRVFEEYPEETKQIQDEECDDEVAPQPSELPREQPLHDLEDTRSELIDELMEEAEVGQPVLPGRDRVEEFEEPPSRRKALSQHRVSSPDLSSSASDVFMTEADAPRSTRTSAEKRRAPPAFLTQVPSSLSPTTIPNTSMSAASTNPRIIPETIRKRRADANSPSITPRSASKPYSSPFSDCMMRGSRKRGSDEAAGTLRERKRAFFMREKEREERLKASRLAAAKKANP